MPDFRSLIDALEAMTKRQAAPVPPAPVPAPVRATAPGLDRRLFNTKNW
jgi:hypothetical protein